MSGLDFSFNLSTLYIIHREVKVLQITKLCCYHTMDGKIVEKSRTLFVLVVKVLLFAFKTGTE